jgi:peptidyl-prolyl cis-trans isomerase C
MKYPFTLPFAALALSTVALAQPPAAPAGNPTAAATVNGETISLDEVDAVLKQSLPLVPLSAAQRRQMRVEVLADMVDEVLVRQFLRKNGPKVDPAEIDAQLKAYGEKLSKEGKSLAAFYKETGQTEAQVRESWTTVMQLTGYVKGLATEEKLKTHYAANKDYFDRVEVKVRHIVVRVDKNAAPADRAAAKERLGAVRAEIAAGRLDFAAAAKKYSHCPSGPTGGDLGYIFRKGGLVDEAFSKAAFALKPGELSGVVETEFGLHLIQVTDRKPGTPSTFEKCLTEVFDAYTDEFRAELVTKLRKEGQIRLTLP